MGIYAHTAAWWTLVRLKRHICREIRYLLVMKIPHENGCKFISTSNCGTPKWKLTKCFCVSRKHVLFTRIQNDLEQNVQHILWLELGSWCALSTRNFWHLHYLVLYCCQTSTRIRYRPYFPRLCTLLVSKENIKYKSLEGVNVL